MDTNVLAALVGAWVPFGVAYLDLRRRTNGSGPLAQKIDELVRKVEQVECLVLRHLEQHAGGGR